jgi:flavin reductase (DIM6/NTAB) family NADH-FMN oxidoreductase RutF
LPKVNDVHNFFEGLFSQPPAMMSRFSLPFLLTLLAWMTAKVAVHALQSTTTPPVLDVPTYSLATLNKDGSTNMNILTTATPVASRPDRVWSLGIYKETLTEENILRNPLLVLQLLTEPQAELVLVLGGASGRDIDKKEECAKLGFEWQDLELEDGEGLQVLSGCTSYLKMRIHGGVVDAGSHLIVPYCQVEEMYTADDADIILKSLSTGRLRELGIITEEGRVAEVVRDHDKFRL